MSKPKPVSRSGRFSGGPGDDVVQFTESISFDRRLWKHDIQGSVAHATMLQSIGVLTKKELAAIKRGLKEIGNEIAADSFPWRDELEDVHMNIEGELTARIPAGAKLHTARSRNDQIALDSRMWLRDEIAELIGEVRALQWALVDLGAKYADIRIPGYTHLQRGQPVYFAHHLLAYVEMLDRDIGRLQDCFQRTNVCPLGSGALAGTTLPIDREMTATLLGFVDDKGKARLTQNSMDGVSDRDYMVEFCGAAALLAVHYSRLSEDLILWSASEFDFVSIGDAYTTGSSLMPQKKNPDIAELARGKSARVIGNLMSLLTLLKGLPMTYNRDLQEDKERLFDTADTVRRTTRLLAAMLPSITVNSKKCAGAVDDPLLLATDVADYLVRKGMPFRDAHHVVGAIVALAEKKGRGLNELSLESYRQISPVFDADVQAVFDLRTAAAQRNITGAPGDREVKRQLRRWQKARGQFSSSA
ncbi:MAG: argininosuccinate lyase [Verrucomicrobiia bacterium]|jgi:argininosuccinate lyase